jgi:hypothetical protein
MANAIDIQNAPATTPVVLITGGKGGVGKSMLALVYIDQLRLRGKRVLYFETDTANCDVFYCLERDGKNAPGEGIDGVTMFTINIENGNSWAGMLQIMEAHPEHVIVIGTASRTLDYVREHGYMLRETLPLIGRKLITLWVIDEQLDSVIQLADHLEVFPESETHVVKNSKYGPDFPFYDGSDTHTRVTEKGGLSLPMPRLLLCVVNSLYSERLAISQALEVLPTVNRVILSHFRKACGKMLEPILAREDSP